MNLKPYAYYWTISSRIEKIKKDGLKVSGGLHLNGVYMTTNPYDFYEDPYYNSLFIVSLRGLEKNLVMFPTKKWVVSLKDIQPSNIYLVGQNFENFEDLKNKLQVAKNNIKNYKRINWFQPSKIAHKYDEQSRKIQKSISYV